LVEKGFKIAIAEQVTEAGRGLVKREVIRVITPGTILEDGIIDAKVNNFIGSLMLMETGYSLTYVDISTGESFLTYGLDKEDAFDKILSLGIKEIVLLNKFDQSIISFLDENSISISYSNNVSLVELPLIKNLDKNQKKAACHLLNYLLETQKQNTMHLMPFKIELKKEYMNIDFRVKKHLEIEESNTNNQKNTLLYFLDETITAMGARRLRYYLNHPLIDEKELNLRYDLIDSFSPYQNREDLIDSLRYIYDINRITSRVAYNTLNARDLSQLRESLRQIPILKDTLSRYQNNRLDQMNDKIDPHNELFNYLEQAIVSEPPLSVKEGGIIKEGFNQKLDQLRDIALHGNDWLLEFEQKEREKTGIKNLKVSYNRVFGYYIEVSKGNIPLIKDEFNYERKQTLANNERYITEELKEKEAILLNAKEKSFALEYDLFKEIRDFVYQYINSLQELASIIADIDFYLAFSIVKEKYHYVRPKFSNNRELKIIKGRHPIVERYTNFIANDCIMEKNQIFLVTGPNMSGKSTYMRMIALIAYMAQVGSFVPADEAIMPIYDAIFTRIGSSDDIAGGKSTFMVEMVESNEALTKATPNSLILFDEIGRGTATYDGMALAQAMVEYIHEVVKAQTIFSTHYHELTALEDTLLNVINLHVKAIEEKNTMVFLHEVERGPSDKSYGIQVASLANLPKSIIKRSKDILKVLENKERKTILDLFNYGEFEEDNKEDFIDHHSLEVIEDIKGIDTDYLTPMDALILLKHLQNKVRNDK
ncbi:DNA mismatch repair protein MutS, partial [Acholeplasma sp. OttesenSCG-928-E16]|nr:DNA mismatch repair protein MutS [Acholeplasma sp. OttesenSCG-928-E16]